MTDTEKWILARLATTADEARAHFTSYRFDLLAQTLYEFAWNDFCDWFVELAKPALLSLPPTGSGGENAAAAHSTRHTLLHVLESLLRLLHPLIPFVTEELWRQVAPRVGIADATISLRPYPAPDSDLIARCAQATTDIEWLKQMVTALRRVRSELGVSPGKQVPLLVQVGSDTSRARLQRFDSQLKFLNRLERIDSVDGDPPPAATGLVGDVKLFVPLEGLVDLDAERARLDKEIARVMSEKDKSAAKIAKFSDKVPAAVVDQERQRLFDWTAQHAALAAQRARL